MPAWRRFVDSPRVGEEHLAAGGHGTPPRNAAQFQCRLFRIRNKRHAYALGRYEEITGWKAPAAGGPPRRTLTGARRRIDTAARRTIAQELGHGRASVSSVYVGA